MSKSKRAAIKQPTVNAPAEPKQVAPPFIFRLPDFATPAAKVAFALAAVLMIVFAFAVPSLTRALVFYRQARLPESQIWNAVGALERGDLDAAREYTRRVIETTITKQLEGNAQYYLAPHYHKLAQKLFAHGMDAEARAVEYKGIRHYHRIRRHLEYNDPWIELQKHYFADDLPKFLQVFEIVCSHSLGSNTEVIPVIGSKWNALRDYAIVRSLYYNTEPAQALASIRSRRATSEPEIEIAAGLLAVRTHLKLRDKAAAIQAARSLVASYPDRLDAQILLIEAERGLNAVLAADHWKGRPDATVLDFAELEAAPTEYAPAEPIFVQPNGTAWMRRIGAAEMTFTAPREANALYLVAGGSEFLDVFSIVLVSVDGGEVFPLYVDHTNPTMYALNLPIEAGEHRIRFEFLNDTRIGLRGKVYDRDVHLMRLVLAHDTNAEAARPTHGSPSPGR